MTSYIVVSVFVSFDNSWSKYLLVILVIYIDTDYFSLTFGGICYMLTINEELHQEVVVSVPSIFHSRELENKSRSNKLKPRHCSKTTRGSIHSRRFRRSAFIEAVKRISKKPYSPTRRIAFLNAVKKINTTKDVKFIHQ